MTEIGSPTHSPDHPDRQLTCEEALEPGLNALADAGVRAGWKAEEVDLAIHTLALARLKAAEANLDTDQAIRRANQMIENGDYPRR